MTAGATNIDALAEKVASGQEISEADGQLLLDTPDPITVGAIADEVRSRLHGPRATFVRVFEVHVDAPPSSLPPRTAAGEFRIVGSPASLDGAAAAVRAAVTLASGSPITGFSLADLLALDAGPLEDVCARLRDAGLSGVAELPVDLVADPASAVRDARNGGLEVLRVTTHAVLPGQRVEMSTRARDLQRAVGGLQAFAPLPGAAAPGAPTTGYDDVKLIAAARLLVMNIPSIQVDWVQYGPKLAQVALTMGANDVDGVAAVDPGVLGTRRSPIEEIRGNIRAAGLEPIERDGRFAVAARQAGPA
jgi:aminodeoxyfutalosine synthase